MSLYHGNLYHFFAVRNLGKKAPSLVSAICSPFGVVVLPPELIVRLIHEHVIFEEHDVEDPPHAEDQWEHEEELPVGPGHDRDEDSEDEQIEKCPLRWSVPHAWIN